MHQAIKRIEELSKQEGGISGLPSGFRDVDKVTAGWQNSDLIIVAARPGMGKTAFVVSMAKNMAVRHQHSGGLVQPGNVFGTAYHPYDQFRNGHHVQQIAGRKPATIRMGHPVPKGQGLGKSAYLYR